MEENKEVLELLQKIEKSNRQQARIAKVQCACSLIAAVLCAGAFLVVFTLLPQIDTVLVQLQTVLGNLETVTDQLASVDLAGMVADVDALVTTGQQSLQETMTKLETIDFEVLTQAVKDLAKIAEPLSKIVKMFGS